MYISEIAETLDISKKAIELYESKGFIQPKKDASGYRVYEQEELKRLKQIKVLRSMDFSLQEIKDILLEHKYERFHEKLDKLQKEEMRIKTIIQYFEDVKISLDEDKELEDVNEDMIATFGIINDKDIDNKANTLNKFNFEKFSFIFFYMFIFNLLAYNYRMINEDVFIFITFTCIALFVLFHIQTFQLAVMEVYEKHKRIKS